ncbi:MAG: EAL domain-containing protein, partial [Eubacteriales bacterium]
NIKELVKYADFAMYEAKHTVKGSMREFNRDIYAEKIYLMENREAINQLIEDRRVRFMFQPIVSAKTGEIYAYEALMRSEHSMFKSPLEILKVAATQFKLSELEDMIIRKAVETAYENRHQFGTRKIYINSIASQMISPEIYLELEEEYGEFLKQIVIEITESEDDAPEKMTEKVLAIKGYGMGLAIDDFGRGFTNELKIIAINPDVIKINMDLLHGIYEDKDKQTLCANIIAYSHSKGICIVAEGIEQVEDLKTVVELGADYLQGYYLAKPSFNPVEILEEKKEIIVRLQDHIFK